MFKLFPEVLWSLDSIEIDRDGVYKLKIAITTHHFWSSETEVKEFIGKYCNFYEIPELKKVDCDMDGLLSNMIDRHEMKMKLLSSKG